MKHIYSTILVISLLVSLNSNGQIVYTDISPDATTTISGSSTLTSLVSIDFNGDNTEEYNFRWDHFGGPDWFLHMTFNGTNEMAGSGSSEFYITPLANGTTIANSLTYGNDFPEPFIGSGNNSNFMGLNDRYVGCKFILGGITHYGWVRVNLDNNLNFIVKDYAYETTPDTAIDAGDIGATTSVEDVDFNQYFKSYPNPVSSYLYLEIKKQIAINSVKIYNTIGQSFNPNYQFLSSKFVVNLEDLNSGVYLLQVQTENNTILTKKIIIK